MQYNLNSLVHCTRLFKLYTMCSEVHDVHLCTMHSAAPMSGLPLGETRGSEVTTECIAASSNSNIQIFYNKIIGHHKVHSRLFKNIQTFQNARQITEAYKCSGTCPITTNHQQDKMCSNSLVRKSLFSNAEVNNFKR